YGNSFSYRATPPRAKQYSPPGQHAITRCHWPPAKAFHQYIDYRFWKQVVWAGHRRFVGGGRASAAGPGRTTRIRYRKVSISHPIVWVIVGLRRKPRSVATRCGTSSVR